MNHTNKPVDVFFSIGSNINPEKNIQFAADQLKKIFIQLEYSSIYRTKAVGFKGDYFLNLVAKTVTEISPEIIIKKLRKIEAETGREVGTSQFSSRTLDIDMILYGSQVDELIRVPRDDIDLYAFVIEPLAEIYPKGIHPISGSQYSTLWEQFDKKEQQTERISFQLS
ncbi:MAG: 2-amino-4-hydroxy-6-hydroxymethyldihydropteridine diphosphokinase [Gammaproteobacteria bacterium]|jgi:2-amino-4-hydroxy-6-hydroxymethyldihydropteridine diphosphokinase|nr:2-amino-4-hydroxy-6-hydroxymethyldihydropteridine diphosphokinase [Gammaproteobacteria bacterium]MBT5217771.1 2-amino-4-hydroxy-6-hydroxymethyldihydropteridine diphosphokinase [Gammaproteobacteria bacterium]MBT5542435.1 2-amino-4-hydroxy-6-hydroxymethyldihydropteridine diphosphokinase [Gammaproteobacteria bacterium]MBT6074432.1 2-amino-4-hydroxy-6-hydroxymethyldihydropteridine diphosphokinase [Gammaproteobacteria bacterium]MBT7753316.1 2-amino-4-hydroxy-6-hydroxymethyldihydropteridine diphos